MKNNFIAILVILLSAQTSLAYEINTHIKLSDEAVNASTLSKDQATLTSLGLKSVDDKKDVFPNSKDPNKPRTVRELIQDGADFEDDTDPIKRPLNHFFDPIRNKPLNIIGVPLLNETSPDWALEDNKEITKQAFSFKDARDYLYKALILSTKDARKKHFALTFQTLGQVIHHIQDMAQPQHVRNDQHLDNKLPNPLRSHI